MILLPFEIIDKILSYRETHPVAKLIKNRYDDYEFIMNEFFTHSLFAYKYYDNGNREYLLEYRRLHKNWLVKIIHDSKNYHWILTHLDYHPANPHTMKNKHNFLLMKSSFISEIPVN
jgi:hypothetical protein